jgi:hypothetical protein
LPLSKEGRYADSVLQLARANRTRQPDGQSGQFDPLSSGVIPNDFRQTENRNATGVVSRARALLMDVQAQAAIAARSRLCKSHPTSEGDKNT